MYVKLYNQILDSSLADNRKLRHFFTDLLLCSDADGNVKMTKNAISNRIRADIQEVEWGLRELQRPDPQSGTPDNDGRRIIPLDGHGYGWKIVNFETYRDYKNSREMRDATAERVRRWRERQRGNSKSKKVDKLNLSGTPLKGEAAYEKADKEGDQEAMDRIAATGRP